MANKLMSVKNATKLLVRNKVVLRGIKEFVLVKNHVNVIHVKRVALLFIITFTPVKIL